jgi:hypothetical protein
MVFHLPWLSMLFLTQRVSYLEMKAIVNQSAVNIVSA